MDVLTLHQLQKHFGEKQVLRGVELSIPEHSIFGILGKNGAGKTTTINIILGFLKADRGEVYVMGEKVHFGETHALRHIGYVPDEPGFYPYMTASEYLMMCGEICGMDRADMAKSVPELLQLVGLHREKAHIRGFSKGMQQRLGIAQALLHRPKLLLCDEPTSALDPEGRKEVLDLLIAASDRATVFFSTHILSDVERICTEVAFFQEGKIALQGSMEELRRRSGTRGWAFATERPEDANLLCDRFSELQRTEPKICRFRGSERRFYEMLGFVAKQQLPLRSVERLEPTLEDLFLQVVR